MLKEIIYNNGKSFPAHVQLNCIMCKVVSPNNMEPICCIMEIFGVDQVRLPSVILELFSIDSFIISHCDSSHKVTSGQGEGRDVVWTSFY